MIEKAISYLNDNGITAFELSGVLTIPVSSPDDILPTVSKVKCLLKDVGYDKSWAVDPYYYEKRESITHDMFGSTNDSQKIHNL